MERDDERRRYRDVGGTSGGLGEFLLGAALLVMGGYLLLNHVVVSGGSGALFGRRFAVGFALFGGGVAPFGVMLLLLFIGVVILFFDGRSVAGWLLAAGGTAAIFLSILLDLHIYFQPTTLFVTLAMFGMIAAGLGLVFRALLPHH